MHASISVTELIQEAVEPYRVRHKEIRIETGPRPGASDKASVEPIGERRPGVVFGLGNIMENAVDFARKGVTIRAHWDGAFVSVVISDDGPGFTPELLDTLGEPYITTRPAMRHQTGNEDRPAGLGLGFFIAKTLLERSGAEVTVANRELPETGAIITITWPHDAYVAGMPGTTAFGSLWPLRSASTAN